MTSEPLRLNITAQPFGSGYGFMPIQISGIGEATVTFQGSLSHEDMDAAKRDGEIIWSDISNGIYTEDVCDSLSIMFPYIRVVITDYVSGTINVTIGVLS